MTKLSPWLAPHPGRSYTAASGAFVRVDYVARAGHPTKRKGYVQFEVWLPNWTSKADTETQGCTAEEFAHMITLFGLEPVGSQML